MVKNNQHVTAQRCGERQQRWALRKLSIGVASVLLGAAFLGGNQVVAHADTPVAQPGDSQGAVTTPGPALAAVNTYMPTPQLDGLQQIKPSADQDNQITEADVQDVTNQVNQYKQSEYQKQLAATKQLMVTELGDRTSMTPAMQQQVTALQNEADLRQLPGTFNRIEQENDNSLQQELKDEAHAIRLKANADLVAVAKSPQSKDKMDAISAKAQRDTEMVTTKGHLWSTRGSLQKARYLIASYDYLPHDQMAQLDQEAVAARQVVTQDWETYNTHLKDDWKDFDIAQFNQQIAAKKDQATALWKRVEAMKADNLAAAKQQVGAKIATLPNLKTTSPMSPTVIAAFQQEVQNAPDVETVNVVMGVAEQLKLPAVTRVATIKVHWVYATVDQLQDDDPEDNYYNNGYMTAAPENLRGQAARPDTIIQIKATQQANGTWTAEPATMNNSVKVTLQNSRVTPNTEELYNDDEHQLDTDSVVTRIFNRVAVITDVTGLTEAQRLPAGYAPILADRPVGIELPQEADQLKQFNGNYDVTFILGRRYNDIQVRYVDDTGKVVGAAAQPTVVYADGQPARLPLTAPTGYQLIPADLEDGPQLTVILTMDTNNITHVSRTITGYKTAQVHWDGDKIQWVVDVPVAKQAAKDQYTPAYQPLTVTAGEQPVTGAPTFTTTADGHPVPTIPDGTHFTKDAGDQVPAWATVAPTTGMVTVNPAAEVTPGDYTVPVTVTYADQGQELVLVKVTVKAPTPAPVEPDQPGTPAEPVQPAEPGTPAEPVQPTQPGTPTAPVQPTQPGTPTTRRCNQRNQAN